MTDHVGAALARLPGLRRMAWRAGRRVYCAARGEERTGDMSTNGEAEVQRRVLAAVPVTTPLQIVDIGANQGDWTLSLLRQMPSARRDSRHVHIDLFEPVPTTLTRLHAAIASVDADALADVHALAMSNEPGEVTISVMSTTGGTNTIHPDIDAAPPNGSVRVVTSTLTEFCRQRGITHIHLAKCDTEGHDSKVLAGARPLLEAGAIDVVQFEYNYRWILSRSYLKDVFDLARGLSYSVARVQPRGIEVFDGWHPELERFFQSNYLLVRHSALPWFALSQGRFDASNTFA